MSSLLQCYNLINYSQVKHTFNCMTKITVCDLELSGSVVMINNVCTLSLLQQATIRSVTDTLRDWKCKLMSLLTIISLLISLMSEQLNKAFINF